MSKVNNFSLSGRVPACFTPMRDNREVDLEKIDAYCQFLSDNGITQVYLNGTTAEGFSLTLDERKKIVEEWMKVGKKTGRLEAIVVHVGALNMHDTLELTHHAVAVGADAIATVPPLFFKPQNIHYLVQYCKEVASAAPNTPFFFYHLPTMVGIEPCIEDFLKAAMPEVPTLIGVKFSSKDLVDVIGSVNTEAPHRDDGRINLMFGVDEMLIAGMLVGAKGTVGSCTNFMPKVFKRMIDNLKQGNMEEANKDQHRIVQVCKIMYKYGAILGHNVAALKCLMKMSGLDMGPPRSPMRPPTEDEMKQYTADVAATGYFDWNK